MNFRKPLFEHIVKKLALTIIFTSELVKSNLPSVCMPNRTKVRGFDKGVC